jgi:hypothetical protein
MFQSIFGSSTGGILKYITRYLIIIIIQRVMYLRIPPDDDAHMDPNM